MKKLIKRVISMFLIVAVLISVSSFIPAERAEASVGYITVETFAESLANELGLVSIKGNASSGYVNALLDKGIIKKGDVLNYKGFLTRGDAMVFLNRADEYLYGDTLTADVVNLAIDERISDISKAKSNKRTDIAKAYLKGFIKGYSNGEYSTDRNMKVKSKITKDGALGCIKMLKDKSLRAQISPDGQLIRTTNLPISAKKFPYILASYPNSYYDWMMQHEIIGGYYYNGKEFDYKNLIDYAAPVDIDKINPYPDWVNYKNANLNTWVKKVQQHLELVFNANYETINDEWVESMIQTDFSYGGDSEELTREKLEKYVAGMKKNKTSVEAARISVDPSSLYFFNNGLYLRANIKYRIVSSVVKPNVDADILIMERPYNNILWVKTGIVQFTDFTLGAWRECSYDICLNSYSYTSDIGVSIALLDEYICKQYQITK